MVSGTSAAWGRSSYHFNVCLSHWPVYVYNQLSQVHTHVSDKVSVVMLVCCRDDGVEYRRSVQALSLYDKSACLLFFFKLPNEKSAVKLHPQALLCFIVCVAKYDLFFFLYSVCSCPSKAGTV